MSGVGALWSDPNFQWVMAGATLLGISSGTIGAFALLRRRSLLGDVLAHAALPGVCIAFMLTQSKELLPLLLGAAAFGLLSVKAIDGITRWTRIKEETALAIVLTVFFGFGILLLTSIQHSGAGNQSGLDTFLFGQAAAMVGNDVAVMAIVAVVVLSAAALFFKEFKLLCFDAGFSQGIGLPTRKIDALLMALIVAAVVIGLQAVGVVLMAALLITPGVAARYWTERLGVMLALSGAFGGLAGAAGTILSAAAPRLPTGPLIVLSATLIFVVSLTLAPQRGLAAKALRMHRLKRRIQQENLLRDVYERYETTVSDPAMARDRLLTDGIDLERMVAEANHPVRLRRTVRRLQRLGLIAVNSAGGRDLCTLTQRGLEEAWKVVHRHRLWEMFLMHEADLDADHVDRDADDTEHFLSPALVKELERLLKVHQREPRILPSAHPLRDADRINARAKGDCFE